MKILTGVLTIAMLTGTVAASGQGGSVAGDWRTDDGKAIVRIAPCGAAGSTTLCGRIQRFLVPEPAGGARDGNNPDRALRSRPLLGVAIFTGLVRRGNSWHGAGYSPEAGRNFTATLTASGDTLTIRGCVAIFCQTKTMARAR